MLRVNSSQRVTAIVRHGPVPIFLETMKPHATPYAEDAVLTRDWKDSRTPPLIDKAAVVGLTGTLMRETCDAG